jgi:hypothetical protein
MEGVMIGSVTVLKTRHDEAPRFWADSSRDLSIELMAAVTIRKTKGKKWKVKTRTIPCHPYMDGSTIPNGLNRFESQPFRPRRRIQASAPMKVGRIRGRVAKVLIRDFPGRW